jgi:hypothetical protein
VTETKSKLILVLFTVSFSLFLFLGIKASQILFSEGDEPGIEVQTTWISDNQEAYPEGSALADPFTLVIYVDDLTKQEPLLQGVWLTRSGESEKIKLFFPIFPSQADDGLRRDLNLRGAFWLEDTLQPSNRFLAILSDRNLSWDQIFLLDTTMLLEVDWILHETYPETYQVDIAQINNLSFDSENRIITQQNQAVYIRDICAQLPLPNQNEILQRFLEGFSGHSVLIGNIPLAFSQSWQGNISCLFPTLTLQEN